MTTEQVYELARGAMGGQVAIRDGQVIVTLACPASRRAAAKGAEREPVEQNWEKRERWVQDNLPPGLKIISTAKMGETYQAIIGG